MEVYTMDRNFQKKDVIEGFSSAIWTERYYGDSGVQVVVPEGSDLIKKMPEGIFLGIDGSDEVMILETSNSEEGKVTITGIALLPWLNNRFIRTTAIHADRYWPIEGIPPGHVIWSIIFYMCCAGSPYLDGTNNIGIVNPQNLVIPGLRLKAFDASGDNIKVGIPYGPVYDAMREIATTYQLGMQITLGPPWAPYPYSLEFRCYKGLDRTSGQNLNPIVRFSPQMDSLSDIKELKSIAALKTLAYAFAPGSPSGLTTVPGVSTLSDAGSYTGFDLRALLVFSEDITTDQIGGSQSKLVEILNIRAKNALTANSLINVVDGEIVPESQLKYGIHYNLGDIIETQGRSGTIQKSRVTEYIRAQDEAGETSYPTVVAMD